LKNAADICDLPALWTQAKMTFFFMGIQYAGGSGHHRDGTAVHPP